MNTYERLLFLALPLILLAPVPVSAGEEGDEFWSDMFAHPDEGGLGLISETGDSFVSAVTEWSGLLAVGGRFSQGGTLPLSNVGAFTGNGWLQLGDGLNDAVFALESWNGELVAGGAFTFLFGNSGLARWNTFGQSWGLYGDGLAGGFCFDLESMPDGSGGDVLVVAGQFVEVDFPRVPAKNIAIYDGDAWDTLDGGLGTNLPTDRVASVAVWNGDLYAGGSFGEGSGQLVNNIARWDGASWQPLGAGVDGDVFVLTPTDSGLLVGGGFDTAGGVLVDGVAAWDGASWGALVRGGEDHARRGPGDYLEFLATIDQRRGGTDRVYVGSTAAAGTARPASGAQAASAGRADGPRETDAARVPGPAPNPIAYLEGGQWHTVGSGVSGDPLGHWVEEIFQFGAPSDGIRFFVAGNFDTAGGKPSFNLALWDGPSPVPVDLDGLRADRLGRDVIVQWTVRGAVDHEGFHVHRQVGGGIRVRVTRELLTGTSRYRFVDPGAPGGALDYWLEERSTTGTSTWHGPIEVSAIGGSPSAITLAPVSPNPTDREARIRFDLHHAGRTEIEIYDVAGRRVARLSDAVLGVGSHEVVWGGQDASGARVRPGLYFAQVRTPGQTARRKIVVER